MGQTLSDMHDREHAGTPLAFFTLVFTLSLPFWMLGYVFDAELMPGLPLASLMVVCPALAMDWVLWWAVGTVTARVLIVWLYTRTGQSVFGISLYHALSNLCWQSYPMQGSYFDPRIDALVTVAIAIVFVRNTPAHRSDAGTGVDDEKTA